MSELCQLEDLSASLAYELAQGLIPSKDIFKKHGLDTQQALLLMRDANFRSMVKDAKAEWASIKNTRERLRLKAQLALEESLLPIFQIIKGDDPAAAKVQAFKEIKQMAGMDVTEQSSTVGNALPSVVIYLGGKEEEPIDITPNNVEIVEEENPLQELIFDG